MSTSVNESRLARWRWLWGPLLILVLLPLALVALVLVVLFTIAFWQGLILPGATIHYPKEAKEELRSIWNVQHRIYKGGVSPGSSTSDYGHLFPDENFFMQFDWWGKNTRHHCINITPKWPNTHIYLNANGDIDPSRTDLDQLKACPGDFKP